MLKIPDNVSISYEEYCEELIKAEAFHGHLCGGMYNGVKMALLAKALLPYDSFPAKDLIVITEIDRCLTDAIISVTGTRLGRRTLKFRDWGRFAATFCSIEAGSGVRIAQQDGIYRLTMGKLEELGTTHHDREKAAPVFFEVPLEQHFSWAVTEQEWDENDLPGKPKTRIPCEKCGETVMDGRERIKDGKNYCQPCLMNL